MLCAGMAANYWSTSHTGRGQPARRIQVPWRSGTSTEDECSSLPGGRIPDDRGWSLRTSTSNTPLQHPAEHAADAAEPRAAGRCDPSTHGTLAAGIGAPDRSLPARGERRLEPLAVLR